MAICEASGGTWIPAQNLLLGLGKYRKTTENPRSIGEVQGLSKPLMRIQFVLHL
jgi:hypothetical protein